MKTLLIIICFAGFCLPAIGQIDTTLGDNYMYEEVYQCGDQTKEQLYDKSKNWVKRNLKSADNLIEFDDEEKKSIIVSGNILLPQVKRPIVTNRIVNFKLSIYFKEGRIKYILDNIIYMCDIPTGLGTSVTNSHYSQPISSLDFAPLMNKKKLKNLALEDTDKALKELLLNYKEYLSSDKIVEEDDW